MIGALVLTGGLIIGTVILGDIYLNKYSTKLVSLKLDTQIIESQQNSLIIAKKNLEKFSALDKIAKQIVPQDKDQAKAVREINNLAAQSNISIASFTFPVSNLGQKSTAPAVTSNDETKPTAPKPSTEAITQAKPVPGLNGLYQLDITILSDTTKPSTYAQIIDFLQRLENNRRTAQVSQISIQPDGNNRNKLNFNITLTVYIKP